MTNLSEWITYHEAAERYGVAYSTVSHMAQIGKIRMERDPARKRNVIPVWEADELWERHVLARKGKRRCKACLEVKPLSAFRVVKNGNQQVCITQRCKDCYRSEIRKNTRKWQTSEQGKKTKYAWYQAQGGYTAYSHTIKARRIARKLAQVVNR